ncbi:MAG: hypothetical protein ABMA13_02090 [Chthoniobacteraceae bacterium]
MFALAGCALLSGGRAAESNLSEKEQRDAFKGEVRKLALAGAFDRLEAAAEDYRQKKSRYPNGYLHLRAFYSAFGDFSDRAPDADWEKLITALNSWCDLKKESPTPRIALAELYRGYAWKARTSKTADQVAEEGWAGMRDRLAKAAEALAAAKALNKKCPAWHSAMQRVALGTGMARNEYDALFEDGVRNAAYYDSLYDHRAYFLLPRWYGQPGEWEQVVLETMARKDVPDAEEVFAKAALYLNSLGYLTGEFSRSAQSWDALKRSFTALQRHYPGSLEVASVFCRIAATVPDLAIAREQWRLIGGRFDPSCWPAAEFAAVGKLLGDAKAAPGTIGSQPPGVVSATSARQKFNPAGHIRREPDGSVWLFDVPMAARRAKNYSMAASVERVLRYYFGMNADERQIAPLADAYVAGGANSLAAAELLKSVEARWKLRLREPVKLETKALQELIRDYNREAKRVKAREVPEQAQVLETREIYGAMQPEVLKEVRTKNRADLSRFQREVQARIDAGIPLLWEVQLGLLPEPNLPGVGGGHTRLIVGYNAKTQEIIYSYSERVDDVRQRMKLDDAWTITIGLRMLEP